MASSRGGEELGWCPWPGVCGAFDLTDAGGEVRLGAGKGGDMETTLVKPLGGHGGSCVAECLVDNVRRAAGESRASKAVVGRADWLHGGTSAAAAEGVSEPGERRAVDGGRAVGCRGEATRSQGDGVVDEANERRAKPTFRMCGQGPLAAVALRLHQASEARR